MLSNRRYSLMKISNAATSLDLKRNSLFNYWMRLMYKLSCYVAVQRVFSSYAFLRKKRGKKRDKSIRILFQDR